VTHTEEVIERLTPCSADSSLPDPRDCPEPVILAEISIAEQDGVVALSLPTAAPEGRRAAARLNGTGHVALPEQEVQASGRRGSTDIELRTPCVAVSVPCPNEETTVGEVVRGLAQALPTIDLCVMTMGRRTRRTWSPGRPAPSFGPNSARKCLSVRPSRSPHPMRLFAHIPSLLLNSSRRNPHPYSLEPEEKCLPPSACTPPLIVTISLPLYDDFGHLSMTTC
jgi:hypothetical protein